MATTPSLLLSCPPSFLGQLAFCSPPLFVPLLQVGRNCGGSVSLKATATGPVLMDKSEAEKVHRLKTKYDEQLIPLLIEEFSYKNIHEVPKIEKIVLNCGIGDAAQNAKGLDAAVNDLARIAGQRPVKTRARESNAAFKIREGQPLGIAVTLRRKLMYSFLDRLINLGFPRSRDFQGVNPNSFDGHGNYSVGVREQNMFPEITSDVVGKSRGMDICIVTTAKTDEEAMRLLTLMGMPFREGGGPATPFRKKKLKSHHFAAKGKGKGKGKR